MVMEKGTRFLGRRAVRADLLAGGGLTKDQIITRTIPHEGIRRSLRNALISCLAAGLSGGLISWLGAGLIVGLIVGLNYGGRAYLKHYVLRFLLWRNDYAPWNYIRFLDYASEHGVRQGLLRHSAAVRRTAKEGEPNGRNDGEGHDGGPPPQRLSAKRKLRAVSHLLRGEPLELVARELNVTAARLSRWRDRALLAAEAALKERERDHRDGEITRLKGKVGEMTNGDRAVAGEDCPPRCRLPCGTPEVEAMSQTGLALRESRLWPGPGRPLLDVAPESRTDPFFSYAALAIVMSILACAGVRYPTLEWRRCRL